MTPWVKNLLLANVAVYFFTVTFPPLADILALRVHPIALLLRPWTIVTYMFVHAGLGHLFFNMLGLFFFGPRLEAKLGNRRFLNLYFLSGITGGVLSFFFSMGTIIVGASGAVFGVFMGFAMFWPKDSIYIWGIFPIQARWLVGIMTGLTLWGGFGGGQDGVAHFAHMGGFLGAYLYLRHLERNSPQAKYKRKMYADDQRKPANDGEDILRWGRIHLENLHEVNRGEVERLQAKIDDQGVETLPLDERAFLNRVSQG